MNTSLQAFLTELYEIDPSLREHEAELVPLVTKLLQSDPQKSPDARFVEELRGRLRDRAATLSTEPSVPFFQKYFYALGGAVAVAVLLPLSYVALNQKSANTPSAPLFDYQIEEKGSEAFGPLTGVSAPSVAERSARPQSGGGGGNPAFGMGGDLAVDEKMMIAPYPMIQYEYVYEGTLDLQPTVSVYKREPSRNRIPLSAIAERLNLGTIDLNSFNGMNIESISFSQDQKFGYILNVSMADASLSIDAKWDQWPQSTCQTEECYRNERITLDQIPEDSVMINIAQDFLSEHGVDLSTYGTAEVDNAWRRDYDAQENKEFAYVPDMQRVVFPLLIEGQPVYDQGGGTMGLSVSVHVKHKRVMSVWGIADRTYAKSDYEGVTDESAIKDYLSRLDNYYPIDAMPEGAEVQKATVILGEPTLSFAVYYRYENMVNEELIVPSLVFKVVEVQGAPEGSFYYRTNVVVPLSAEILKAQTPVFMPLMEKAADETEVQE